MRFLSRIIILLFIGSGILSIVYYLRSSNKRSVKIVTIIVRLIQTLLFIAAFSEPVITCHRLIHKPDHIAVLVDASESMLSFNVSSHIARIDSLFNHYTSQQHKSPIASWYLFGDTLRSWDPSNHYSSSDHKSIFPSLSASPSLSDINKFIIVTDANWTNNRLVADDFDSRSVWYVRMTSETYLPFITCELPDTIQSSTSSPIPLIIPVHGFSTNNQTISCSATSSVFSPINVSVSIDSGAFSNEFSITIPSLPSGFHQIHFHFSFSTSTGVTAHHQLLFHINPQHFSYIIKQSSPTLDMRFLRNALTYSRVLKKSNSRNNKIDVVFLSGLVSKKQLPHHKARVVIGNSSENHQNKLITSPWTFRYNKALQSNEFSSLLPSELPPIRVCDFDSLFQNTNPLLSIISQTDTVPILYSTVTDNIPTLICSAVDFWKWDFLPLSRTSGESDNFRFTTRLVQTVEDMLFSLNTDTFLVLPIQQPRDEMTISFHSILPHSIKYSSKYFSCTITDSPGTVFVDTTIPINIYQSVLSTFTIPPLPLGTYLIKETDSKQRESISHQFTVVKNMHERQVQGQNRHFLEKRCHLLEPDNSSQASMIFTADDYSIKEKTYNYQYLIRRGWILFISLLSVLLFEWFIRKITHADD